MAACSHAGRIAASANAAPMLNAIAARRRQHTGRQYQPLQTPQLAHSQGPRLAPNSPDSAIVRVDFRYNGPFIDTPLPDLCRKMPQIFRNPNPLSIPPRFNVKRGFVGSGTLGHNAGNEL
jgi:hypothetical protein